MDLERTHSDRKVRRPVQGCMAAQDTQPVGGDPLVNIVNHVPTRPVSLALLGTVPAVLKTQSEPIHFGILFPPPGRRKESPVRGNRHNTRQAKND